MTRSELGEKRICAECKGKFYDLNRSPIICPYCQHEYVVASGKDEGNLDDENNKASQQQQPQEQQEVESGIDSPEIISLEEVAEDENMNNRDESDEIPSDIPDVEIEEDSSETQEDNSFIEDEEESSNIADIIPMPKDEKDDL